MAAACRDMLAVRKHISNLSTSMLKMNRSSIINYIPSCSLTSSSTLLSTSTSSTSTASTATSSHGYDTAIHERIGCVLISTADPESNLPHVSFPPLRGNESSTELSWRTRIQRVQLMHQEFWTWNNKAFKEAKRSHEATIHEERKRESNGSVPVELTEEEYAAFYTRFLHEHAAEHAIYRRQWCKERLGLLLPSFRVSLERLWATIIRT